MQLKNDCSGMGRVVLVWLLGSCLSTLVLSDWTLQCSKCECKVGCFIIYTVRAGVQLLDARPDYDAHG